YLLRHGILMNRDECRAPMQWDHGPNAGFSPAASIPWLPVHPRHPEVNVAAQERDPSSPLNCYRGLLKLRPEQRALHAGGLELLDPRDPPPDVVAYRRFYGQGARREEVHVFLNFAGSARRLDLRGRFFSGRALFSSHRAGIETPGPERALGPYEGVV